MPLGGALVDPGEGIWQRTTTYGAADGLGRFEDHSGSTAVLV